MKPYNLPFRIRKVYFDLIQNGEKHCEIRKDTDFWYKRMLKAIELLNMGEPVIAVLVSGKRIMRLPVKRISLHITPYEILKREPSEQGLKDIGTGSCWAVWFKEEQCP